MAPGRRRGLKGDRDKSLSLGDLVLAKVKGFPAWPAKISKPEDWDRAPDPKKYFVQFFGTEEIAFVAPTDIQAFTSETKNKLLTRCQGKTVKYFAPAVKEICQAFKLMKQKKSGRDSVDKSDPDSESLSADREEDALEDSLKDGSSTDGISRETEGRMLGDSGSGWERGSSRHGELDYHDMRSSLSCKDDEIFSPVTSPMKKKKSKPPTDDVHNSTLKDVVIALSCSKEEDYEDNQEFANDGKRARNDGSLVKAAGSGDLDREKKAKTSSRKTGQIENMTNRRHKNLHLQQNTSSKAWLIPKGSFAKELDGGAFSEYVEHAEDTFRKSATASNLKESYKDLKVDIGASGGKKSKELGKRRKFLVVDEEQEDEGCTPQVQATRKLSAMTEDAVLGSAKHEMETNEVSYAAEIAEHADSAKDACKGIAQRRKQGCTPQVQATDKFSAMTEDAVLGSAKREMETDEVSYVAETAERADSAKDACKGIAQRRKQGSGTPGVVDQQANNPTAEDRVASKVQTGKASSKILSDEDDLPPSKRRREATEALSGSANKRAANRMVNIAAAKKNDASHADVVKSPVAQLHTKRRAVRICDDNEEERPKTPVHGRPASKVGASAGLSASAKKIDVKGEVSAGIRTTAKDLGTVGSGRSEKQTPFVKRVGEHVNSSLILGQTSDKRPKNASTARVSHSPVKPQERVTIKTKKQILGSPGKSSLMGGTITRQEATKADVLVAKVPDDGNIKKAQAGSTKTSGIASHSLRYNQSQANTERNNAICSERSGSIERNSSLEVNNSDHKGGSFEQEKSSGERLEGGADDSLNPGLGSQISGSHKSMKNLIAAAQARRKQAHSQGNNVHDDASTAPAPSINVPVRSASPPSAVQNSLPESSNVLQQDVQGLHSIISKVSPHRDSSSNDQPDADKFEETRIGSEHQLSAGLPSGGTDAAVSRDAFEGMIETLSRTRESIGRATRLAIDCAKYGIANEVVELLIRKLDSEPDNHRKIDLFFLLDSITQCSHKDKGIAGASYIPTVQAALPRILGAAAPPGTAANENRRQCLKVLRLWLERKILPESLLRRYIDDMGVSKDEASAVSFLRRPSRAERAVDDPIREMDGILLDEYGSNATFHLPGLFSSHMFEEVDDDSPEIFRAERDSKSPVQELPVAVDSEACAVTPSDKRHCILEDVDGELEMEDVSGHPKDEPLSCENGSIELPLEHQHTDEFMETDSEEVSPYYGSPPLPLMSPPPTPPLPSSPPPTPSPPPPPSSPSPLPPLPSLSSLPQVLPAPPSGPSSSVPAQPSLRPSVLLQQFHIPPPPIPISAQNLTYQPPLTLEKCSTLSGNQLAQTAPTFTARDQTDASIRGDMYSHQSLSFMPAGNNSSYEVSGFSSLRPLDYGRRDLQVNPPASLPNQQFQPGNPPLPRPFPPIRPPMSNPSHYLYQNSPVNQLPQHPYSRPHSLPNVPDGPRQYIADEQWRRPTNEFKVENSRGAWMGGGGTPSFSGPYGAPYSREGYFPPHFERPAMNKVGFQPEAPVPGHAARPPLTSRPDMHRWRPS